MHRRRTIIGFLLSAALAGACQPPTGKLPVERETIVAELFWPQPPLRPRIRFERAVARPQDLGIQTSFWQRVGEIIVGKQEEWLIRPTGVAANGKTIFVADPGAQAFWILDPKAGQFNKIQDAGPERLISPVSVTLGSDNRLYVADSYLGKVLVFDTQGKVLSSIADPNLRRPAGVVYDSTRDRLYVADSAAHRVWVFAGNGKPMGSIGRRGTGNGEFNFPTHVAVDREGSLYVTDSLGFRLQFFSSNGTFAGQFGRHGDSSGDFASPKGVALDSEGHVYVVDALFDAVQIFDRRGRYLLTFGERGISLGQFWLPGGIFIDEHDRIYVADAYNQRIQIFQFLAGGGDG
ncbi:MAG: 6-bladed beta-propeller [Deltaproteobacteria bacterium]|nr:6-bladed beta-propeller [Deltaproteobacteria bacterium]